MISVKPFKLYQKILICVLPVFLIACAFAFGKIITVFDFKLYDCVINKYTGIYCPGCGMTRSVCALCQGNLTLSLRENAMAAIGVFLLAMLYAELVFRAFGRKLRTFIHNKYFLAGILIFWGVYCIARNFIPQIAPV